MPKDPLVSWDLVTTNKSESKTSCLFCRCREIIRWHQWPLPNREESLILSLNLWNAVAKEKDANLKKDVFPCKQDPQKHHEHYSSSCANACLHVVQCFSSKSSPLWQLWHIKTEQQYTRLHFQTVYVTCWFI